ncbi:MAG: hypothetical protein LBU91_09310 [Bacteroidales bacterium]|jgi:hypothetical protein|nr:hypothetical protein [Bacteroidales bacterium]
MKPGKEILETFTNEKIKVLSKLAGWTFEELNELKERCESDYKVSLTYQTEPGYSMYIRNRIDLLEEAITIKTGDEEQAWDYLT